MMNGTEWASLISISLCQPSLNGDNISHIHRDTLLLGKFPGLKWWRAPVPKADIPIPRLSDKPVIV